MNNFLDEALKKTLLTVAIERKKEQTKHLKAIAFLLCLCIFFIGIIFSMWFFLR